MCQHFNVNFHIHKFVYCFSYNGKKSRLSTIENVHNNNEQIQKPPKKKMCSLNFRTMIIMFTLARDDRDEFHANENYFSNKKIEKKIM